MMPCNTPIRLNFTLSIMLPSFHPCVIIHVYSSQYKIVTAIWLLTTILSAYWSGILFLLLMAEYILGCVNDGSSSSLWPHLRKHNRSTTTSLWYFCLYSMARRQARATSWWNIQRTLMNDLWSKTTFFYFLYHKTKYIIYLSSPSKRPWALNWDF